MLWKVGNLPIIPVSLFFFFLQKVCFLLIRSFILIIWLVGLDVNPGYSLSRQMLYEYVGFQDQLIYGFPVNPKCWVSFLAPTYGDTYPEGGRMVEVTDELWCPVFRGQEEKTICKVLRSESFLFQVKRRNNYVFLAKSGTCTWRRRLWYGWWVICKISVVKRERGHFQQGTWQKNVDLAHLF